MYVEFVRQDLERHEVMQWPLRLQRPRPLYDGLWCEPSSGIPSAECFDGDAKRSRALRLGQAEPRPNLTQDRGGLSHPSRRWHRSNAGWKRMDGDEDLRLMAASEMGQKLREVFQLVGSDRSS